MNIDPAFMDTDTTLMLGLKEGKEFCMGFLLQRYQRPVTQYIYRRIGNRAVAEELTQNVFLRIFSARKTYQPTASFTSWLFRIAHHLALNWMRDHRNEATVMSLSAGMERDAERPIADRKADY
jgi:RNA polymerase sigma-70 factor (ECF subfamily)